PLGALLRLLDWIALRSDGGSLANQGSASNFRFAASASCLSFSPTEFPSDDFSTCRSPGCCFSFSIGSPLLREPLLAALAAASLLSSPSPSASAGESLGSPSALAC